MGAYAFLKSDYFRAFGINVKTIAPLPKLYQFGHAIWWYTAPAIIKTFLETYDFTGKTIILFATSGGSGLGRTAEDLEDSCPGAVLKSGKLLNGKLSESALRQWAESM